MNKIIIHISVLITIVFAASPVQAQLPSEKPMSAVYSKPVQAKLNAPKQSNRVAVLPSEAKLPVQVTKAAARTDLRKNEGLTTEEKTKKLPSNSKNRTPPYKKPKRL